MREHSVVCTVEVPIVRHTGLVCSCGEIFALDVGDFQTYIRQMAIVMTHMTHGTSDVSPQPTRTITGSWIRAER